MATRRSRATSGREQLQQILDNGKKATALVEEQITAADALAVGTSARVARKVLAVYKKRVPANKRQLMRH